MSDLQDRLDEFKRTFKSGAPPYNVPPEAIKTMHLGTAELKASRAGNRALMVGAPAPAFTLFNQDHVSRRARNFRRAPRARRANMRHRR
jgi:hypothetical protein